jgi:hypothetical protein
MITRLFEGLERFPFTAAAQMAAARRNLAVRPALANATETMTAE